jgi:hypothetical protein
MAVAFSISLAFAQGDVAEKAIKTYPYFASEPRSAQIKGNDKKIEKGMAIKQATQLLGEPDEFRHLYEPKIKNPRQIGYTHWYFIQRNTDHGSQHDKDEKLVRVSSGLDWIVMSVDHWGFNDKECHLGGPQRRAKVGASAPRCVICREHYPTA